MTGAAFRRLLLWQRPEPYTRKTHECRRPSALLTMALERLHEIRRDSDARPRQRCRRRQCHELADGLSRRRGLQPRLPAVESRRVHGRRLLVASRGRRRADRRRRPVVHRCRRPRSNTSKPSRMWSSNRAGACPRANARVQFVTASPASMHRERRIAWKVPLDARRAQLAAGHRRGSARPDPSRAGSGVSAPDENLALPHHRRVAEEALIGTGLRVEGKSDAERGQLFRQHPHERGCVAG